MSMLGLRSLSPDSPSASELSLADLLARGVTIEWFEAVAVVRATLEKLDGTAAHQSTPDLGQIWLNRDGAIRVSGGSYEDEPVRRVGQLLQALLTQTEPPATLRLIVGNATAHAPVYAGLHQFDEAIAYFERPDRPGLLRALFARADGRVQPLVRDASPSLDDVAPLPARAATPALTSRQSVRRLASVAAIAIVAGITMVLVARMYLLGERVPVARITGAAQHATDTIAGVMLTGISAVTERVGLGRVDTQPEPVSTTGAGNATSHATASRNAHSRSLLKSVGVIQAFDLDGASMAPPAAPAVGTPGPAISEPESETLKADPPRVVDTNVYSSDFKDVIPPRAIRPQLPRVLPEGVAASELSGIELIVQQDGSVESVKLVPGRRAASVKDAMLLSAAKTWRFAPATKDRVPVRYRKTIWIIAE
jgi:hypothetical protein